MQDPDFAEIVGLICKEDSRFDRKAYDFIRLGLDHTVKELKSKESSRASRSRHVSGPELLEGLRVYALDQFGPLTKTVLESWGIRRCSDFGDIVFNLIEYNVFSKTDNDRREDFSDLYSFEDAFVKPFLPTKPGQGCSEAVGSP
ncbi:MAG: Minf_1886 family protein [Opitutus sp.]